MAATLDDPRFAPYFNQRFARSVRHMTELMSAAQGLLLHLRLAAEAHANRGLMEQADGHQDDSNACRSLSLKDPRKATARIVPPDRQERMWAIMQLARAVAGARWRRARKQLLRYRGAHGLRTTLEPELACPAISDGERQLGYLLQSARGNLLPEEFAVFRGQGCAAAAQELFKLAHDWIEELEPDLGVCYFGLHVHRALALGRPIAIHASPPRGAPPEPGALSAPRAAGQA